MYTVNVSSVNTAKIEEQICGDQRSQKSQGKSLRGINAVARARKIIPYIRHARVPNLLEESTSSSWWHHGGLHHIPKP